MYNGSKNEGYILGQYDINQNWEYLKFDQLFQWTCFYFTEIKSPVSNVEGGKTEERIRDTGDK